MPGQPKPGAVVLVDAMPSTADGFPLLITQNFGRGRTAVFATGGSWRWQMLLPLADKSHEMFYTQLLRWLVNDTPRRVVASTPQQVLEDESHVKLRAAGARSHLSSVEPTRPWKRTSWGRRALAEAVSR